MGLRKLPEFEGYTVDLSLRQFRRADLKRGVEFIDFDSEEGQALLARMAAAGASRELFDVKTD